MKRMQPSKVFFRGLRGTLTEIRKNRFHRLLTKMSGLLAPCLLIRTEDS